MPRFLPKSTQFRPKSAHSCPLTKLFGLIFGLLSLFCRAHGSTQGVGDSATVLQAQDLLNTTENFANPTANQKRDLIQKISVVLQKLNKIQDFPEGSLLLKRSRIVGLSNSLIALDDRVRSAATKQASGSVYLSYEQSQSSRRKFGGFGLKVDVDEGRHFEWRADLGTMSPLREASGQILWPIKEVDAFTIREGWLKLKNYNTLQLKIGLFPDEESLLKPQYWSFYSTQGLVNLVNNYWIQVELRARHDRYSYLSPSATSTSPAGIERNLSELLISQNLSFGQFQWRPKVSYGVHWYSDPNNQLNQLSLGKASYESASNVRTSSGYRISNVILSSQLLQQNSKVIKFQVETWTNHLASKDKSAQIVRLDVHFLRPLTVTAEWLNVGLVSVPEVGTSEQYRPGSRAWRFGTKGTAQATDTTELSWELIGTLGNPKRLRVQAGVIFNIL